MLPVYALTRDPQVLFWTGLMLGVFFACTGCFGSYYPHLYPTRVRNTGAGFCFNMGCGVAAFAPFALGQMASSLGLSTSIGLCGAAFACAGIIMLFMPEVDGK